MMAPPKGSNNAILLNASFIDTFDKYKIKAVKYFHYYWNNNLL